MEKFVTRVLIITNGETEIAYLYNREAFELLNIERLPYDKSQFLEVGKIINYEERKYKISEINFKLNNEMSEIDNSLGTNIHSPTELSNYNCQITIYVEEIN